VALARGYDTKDKSYIFGGGAADTQTEAVVLSPSGKRKRPPAKQLAKMGKSGNIF
jgi:hypothetical protein